MALRFLVAVLIVSPLAAADDLQALFDAFAKEKAAAKGETAAADKLAAKAEEARKNENPAAAARLIRDARWALPAVPLDLPEGVRVLGYSRLRHSDRVNSLRYNRDGTLMVSASTDRTVRVWDVATGREVIVYRGHVPPADAKTGISNVPLRVTDAVFLPDGSIASAGEQQIHVWDPKTGKLLKRLAVETPPAKDAKKATVLLIKSLDVSDDGKSLVSGSDDKIVRVWNLETRKIDFASTPHSSRIESVAWQPKGRHVAAVDADGFLSVYSPTGENKSPLLKVQVTDGGNTAAYSVRFTPDGTKLLTGGGDKSPRLTPAPGADGAVPPNVAAATQKLPPHTDDILAVGVTADGKYFVTGGRDKAVRVVDNLGQIVRAYTAGAVVTALAVRPDGLQIAAACDDGSLRTWDFLATDDHRTVTDSKEPLWAAAVNADGSLFAAAGADKSVRIYSATGKLLHKLDGATAAVTSLAFLSNDKLLSAGGDKLLRLWDAKAGQAIAEWTGHPAAVLALAATPDGKTVVSGSADKSVNVWNAATGKVEYNWTARSAVTAVAIAADASHILVGCADGGLSVLEYAGKKPSLAGYVNAHISGVSALTFGADGSRFASAGGDDAKIWKFVPGGTPAILKRLAPALKPTTPTPSALSAVAYSPDGRRLAAAGADRIVRLFDTNTGLEIRSLRGCGDWVTSLCFAPDGERLFTVAADAAVRLFDLIQADAVRQSGHTSSVRAVAASRDGARLASVGDDRMLRIWDRASGREIAVLPVAADKLFCVAFVSPDTVATGGSDRRLRVWSIPEKKELSATPTGEIYGITVSPDGTKLGVWSRTNDVDTYSVHDAADPKKTVTVSEKGRKVSAATFAADLSLVLSADESGAVIVHDLATKSAVGKEWKLAKSRIADLGLSADRKFVAAFDDDGTLTVGNLETRVQVATGKGPADGINGLLIAPGRERVALLGVDRDLHFFDFAGQEVRKLTLPSSANSAGYGADGRTLFTANTDGSLYAVPVP